MNFSLAMDGRGDDYEDGIASPRPPEPRPRDPDCGNFKASMAGSLDCARDDEVTQSWGFIEICLLPLKQSRLAFQSRSIGLIAS